jgi:ABC-type branched-subunit amino acid transport system ATPase component
MSHPPPISLNGAGVRYNMQLRRKRSLRKSVTRTSRLDEKGYFWALRDITIKIHEGETVAVIGANGAGKSTLLQLLAGILEPDEGSIAVYGSISTLLHIGAGFDDELNADENILLVGAFLGIPASIMRERAPAIIEFAGIQDFSSSEVRTYSSGMRARLGFSVATAVKPDVLLVDEVLSTGDASFREKAKERILELVGNARAAVYVTHDLDSAASFCTRAIELEGGKIVADGPAKTVIAAYQKKMALKAAATS